MQRMTNRKLAMAFYTWHLAAQTQRAMADQADGVMRRAFLHMRHRDLGLAFHRWRSGLDVGVRQAYASAAVDELGNFQVAMAFAKWFHVASVGGKQWMLCGEPSHRHYGRLPDLNAEIDSLVESRMRGRIDNVMNEKEEKDRLIESLEREVKALVGEKAMLEEELVGLHPEGGLVALGLARSMLARSPQCLDDESDEQPDELGVYRERHSQSPSPTTEMEKSEALGSPGSRERKLAKQAAKSWANEAEVHLMRSP